jgi:hypothetical protein
MGRHFGHRKSNFFPVFVHRDRLSGSPAEEQADQRRANEARPARDMMRCMTLWDRSPSLATLVRPRRLRNMSSRRSGDQSA